MTGAIFTRSIGNLRLLAIVLLLPTGLPHAVADNNYHTEMRIRQLEIDQKMGQIQQDMTAQSEALRAATSSRNSPSFGPVLPGYSGSAAYARPGQSTGHISAAQLKRYLEGLGDPARKTGIYAYPPEQRLYRYGLMCIEAGLVGEGIHAISDHFRIQAEQRLPGKITTIGIQQPAKGDATEVRKSSK